MAAGRLTRRFHLVAILPLALATAFSSDASALQQPDNTVIPVGASLQTLFDGRGEGISALADAVTVPETFTPSCALTFEVLQRNAGYNNSFGWYNVTGQKPAPSELHEFLTCSDAVGTIKVLAIKDDPNYAGGEIGFYQAAGGGCPTALSNENLFFSEKGYNPDSQQMNPYIHLLTYNSTVTPNAFYFAWEDLLVGNDNDFDDLTTFVTGITCAGGGGPCDTGEAGICAQGVEQCQNGVLACVQTHDASSEVCDAFDNDCDGEIDNGDLCQANEVCDKGVCVPLCSSGEFKCAVPKVCSPGGLCVDPECVGVDCPDGSVCVAGQCQGPCDGVVCPYGQVCQLGACVDPCSAITCDARQLCLDGVCTDHCDCTGCPDGFECQPSGECINAACVGVRCDPFEHCDASGDCIDNCDGASCPSGQVCEMGECVAGRTEGNGGEGGGTLDGFNGGAGGTGGSSAGGSGGATNNVAGDGSSSGCGCRVGADPGTSRWLISLGALLYFVRRRRSAIHKSRYTHRSS